MFRNPWALLIVSPVAELERMLGHRWKNIEDARLRTQASLQELSSIIEGKPGSDTSVIVHGSLAREECTNGSDLDWTLLVDGVADASVQQMFLAIKNSLNGEPIFKKLGLKPPGREGTFGALTFSQPMMHYIGGEEDSNSNTTRRVLLLLEALPIGERGMPLHRELGAFDRVRQSILRRYLDEDRGLLRKSREDGKIRWVPLFLLNDFARYWRTMAVDFA
jgi:predicted nucleotidyltransferase